MRFRSPILALVLILAAPLGARAQFHHEDTLRGGAPTMGNAIGGSFGPEGWTVTGPDDRIWWALPRLASGSFEFTVANVTLAVLPLNDHEIWALYEAGHGISEPIRYSPEFRQNYYKSLLRIYGTAESGREGQQKLMWGMCPSGAPGYYEGGPPCTCENFFEEPFGGDGTWDGSPQRFRIEWGGGHTRLYRNGAMVLDIDWSESGLVFGPHELHAMLGSPRNETGLSTMPIGATFSDVVIDGTPGPIAVCGGVIEADAGVPPADAGMMSMPLPMCSPATRLGAGALAPAGGRGAGEVFGVTYRHCDGWEQWRVVQILFGDSPESAATLGAGYEGGRFFTGATESCAPGEARRLATPYGTLDCARSRATMVGADDLRVEWAIDFDTAAFAGTRGIFVDAKGPADRDPEPRLGWTRLGEYTVEAGTPGVDAGTAAGMDGGTPGSDSGSGGGDGGRRPGSTDVDGGCSCRAPSGRGGTVPGLLAAAALALGLVLRARRARRC